jgi:hypothetical protein
MRGHKKTNCLSAQSSPTPAHSVPKENDLEESLGRLQLDVHDEAVSTKQRRRSSMMKQPSLESLTSSAVGTLEAILSVQKQLSDEAHSRSSAPPKKEENDVQLPKDDKKSIYRPRVSIPGEFVKFELEEISPKSNNLSKSNPTEPSSKESYETPSRPLTSSQSQSQSTTLEISSTKKRKSVRIGLPGPTRSSLRHQPVHPFHTTEASSMEKNDKFIKTMENEASSKPGGTGESKENEQITTKKATSYLTTGIVLGAATMWASLAFS